MIEHSKLPGYIIDADGTVFYKSNGEPVDLKKGLYKLQTDEEFKTYKGKIIKLIRRLSKDDIKKMYHHGSTFEKKPVNSVSDNIVNSETIKEDIKPHDAQKKRNGVVIDGKEYESANKAAKCLKTSVNTVINRCKNKKFDNYNFL